LVALLQILVYSMTDMYHGRVNISCLFLLCALVDFACRMEPEMPVVDAS
jgi:hypothetical protein